MEGWRGYQLVRAPQRGYRLVQKPPRRPRVVQQEPRCSILQWRRDHNFPETTVHGSAAVISFTGLVELIGRATTKWVPIYITARALPHCFPSFALHLDYDRQLQTTKGSEQGCPCIGYGHRRSEHRQGGYEHYTSKPHLRLCGDPPRHDPGEFPSLSQSDIEVHT